MPAPIEVSSIAVNSRAVKNLHSGHPWVYRSDLSSKNQGVSPAAALVHITDDRGRFLSSALSSSSSQIALRVLSGAKLADADLPGLISQRISSAALYRRRFVHDSDAFRLVFSEADALPGLIVDKYKDVLTVQFLSQAMDRDDLRAAVVSALLDEFGQHVSIAERADPRIRQLEKLSSLDSRMLHGSTSTGTFQMNGLTFRFNALAGQKSGAFLDQRQNYASAAAYAHGEALDVFCYQGGFAVHLARVCDAVTAVDSSRPALEIAEANAAQNSALLKSSDIEWIEADAFELLKDYSSAARQYDTIVLDPPAFAKSKRMLPQAMRGYKELNVRALKMLRPGGILITNSCSHHVSEQDFIQMLSSAASDTRRNVKILEKRSQSVDHPVVATIPETAYLKCLILTTD